LKVRLLPVERILIASESKPQTLAAHLLRYNIYNGDSPMNVQRWVQVGHGEKHTR
jgi:hypothetical protein